MHPLPQRVVTDFNMAQWPPIRLQLFEDWMWVEYRVRNSLVYFCRLAFSWGRGWGLGGKARGRGGRSKSRLGCYGHRLTYSESSLISPTLKDTQETLKKQDLSFRVCPELSGHGTLEEEFTSPRKTKNS